MPLIPPSTITRISGVLPAGQTARVEDTGVTPDNDRFTNVGRVVLYIESTSASVRTLTIHVHESIDSDLIVPDRDITVPIGGTTTQRLIKGPFPVTIYNNASNEVEWWFDAVDPNVLVWPIILP